LQDNAPSQKSCKFLPIFGQKNVKILYRSPYPPDLSPPDYFLFPKSKMKLLGLHFADVAQIKKAVLDELNKFQKEEFSAALQKLYDRAKACIYSYISMELILKK
jgi:hypothetical protein